MPGGRPRAPNSYMHVYYNGRYYLVGIVKRNDTYIKFVCDIEDEVVVRSAHWHVIANNYVAFDTIDPSTGNKNTYGMHNYILQRDSFQGKGQSTTIDHINGIGFDNRRENLRELSSSLQLRNTIDRKRKVNQKLPVDIDISEIPRNIWYMPANLSHGDRFVIEFKGIPGVTNILIKTTASKSISTRDKLNEAIRIRNEYLELYPDLVKFSRDSNESKRLKKEYEEIIALAKI
jgi:hypothetical protein